MDFWRVCVWTPGQRNSRVNGHPLYVWPHQGAGRVDDPYGGYRVLYAGDSPDGAIAEFLGNYARWTPAVLSPPPAAPPGTVLALAHLTGDLDVLDLDDPYVLVEWGLRPSSVVSRDRAVTQQWARAVFDTRRYAGLAWWSYRDPAWTSYGLWDLAELQLTEEPEPLTLDQPALVNAGRIISRVIEA